MAPGRLEETSTGILRQQATMVMHDLTVEDVNRQIAHASDNRRVVVICSMSAMTLVATIAVILRLVARRVNQASWRKDDYAILVALVGALTLASIASMA